MMLKLIRWYLYQNGYWYQISKKGKVWMGGNGNVGLGTNKPTGKLNRE